MNPRTSRKKTRKQKAANFVIQGSILAMAGIVVRIIGMLYRMPLNDIIGKQGNGYYTSAFNVYNILLILSSYSMPVAVSKMISARLARGEHRNCSRILKAALIYATAVGGIAAVVLWFGADLFAQLIKTPFSRYALKTLAPTIWIMAYLGVLRGYFQGTGTMVPTAVSQILEQIVNAVVSVVAAGILFGVGTSINAAQGAKDYSYALGAAGGTIGTGAGALTACLFFICLTASKGRERRQMVREDVSGRTESYRRIFYVLTITVLPIVISSGIYNCSNVVDNTVLEEVLQKNLEEVEREPYTEAELEFAKKLAGTYGGGELDVQDLLKRYEKSRKAEVEAFLNAHKDDVICDYIVPLKDTETVMAGSTDVGDVSWVCPTAQINAVTEAAGTPGHSWQQVSQGKSSIAHKGMLFAGKVMAGAIIDVLEDQRLIGEAKDELKKRVGEAGYVAPIPKDVRPMAINPKK